MSLSESFPCPHCHVGRLRLHLVTYVHVYHNTLVSVPNTPAWECDFCQALEYDADALLRIEALVGQAGPPPNRYRPPAQPQATPEIAHPPHKGLKRN